jgi:hypothetical protein
MEKLPTDFSETVFQLLLNTKPSENESPGSTYRSVLQRVKKGIRATMSVLIITRRSCLIGISMGDSVSRECYSNATIIFLWNRKDIYCV